MKPQISADAQDLFIHHLDKMDGEKISLVLYTRGGDTMSAWSIANLIRQFCDHFEVIVPSKCHSAGTLLCLAANSIVMTKQATLGPIDPSLISPLGPQIHPANPNARFPVSVEAMNGFFEMVRSEIDAKALPQAFQTLSQQVHPLVIGDAYRRRSQIRMLGERLLRAHLTDKEKINKLLNFLCSESGSHDYTINRKEAKEELNLKIEKPDDKLYNLIKAISDSFTQELELTSRYEPQLLLAGKPQVNYSLVRALVESVEGGSHRFVSEGELTLQQIPTPQGIMQDALKDRRSFEGWRHEK